jgi:LPXTG-motif cell wall-anchored protein
MPLPRRRVAALAATVALAAPASALAQSAGDDQYEDPFAGEDQGQQGGGGGGGGGGSGQAPAPPESSTPAPATPPAPAPAPADPTGATSAAPSSTQPQLPRTGADAGAVLLVGSILLAGGVALRVRLRER